MKNYLILLLILFFIINNKTIAQNDELLLQKGKYLLSGTLSFKSYNSRSRIDGTIEPSDDKRIDFDLGITPSAYYFLNSKIALGAALSYNINFARRKGINLIKSNASSYYFVPSMRYYKSLGKQFYLFGEANLGLYFGTSFNQFNDVKNKDSNRLGIDMNIRSGLAYFLHDKVSLQVKFGKIGYRTQTVLRGEGDSDTNGIFETNLNISSLGLGVAILL